MCTAHPYNHACGHNSVQWNFCPRSTINFQNGLTTPCDNQHSARPMDTEDACPIWICRWADKGGVWRCCQCKNQPNHLGWCVFERPRQEYNAITNQWEEHRLCNHVCCDSCSAYVGDDHNGKGSSSHNGGSSSKSRRGGGGSSSAASSSKKKHKSKR